MNLENINALLVTCYETHQPIYFAGEYDGNEDTRTKCARCGVKGEKELGAITCSAYEVLPGQMVRFLTDEEAKEVVKRDVFERASRSRSGDGAV